MYGESALLILLYILCLVNVQAVNEALFGSFPACERDKVSPDIPLATLTVSSLPTCSVHCTQLTTCVSFNLCGQQCQLLSTLQTSMCAGLVSGPGCIYTEQRSSCQNGGAFNPPNCDCVDGYAGVNCERPIRSCKEGKDLGLAVNRFYTVKPFGSPVSFQVYCVLQYSQTALIFVRKEGPACPGGTVRESWDKTWQEYKDGFGDPTSCDYFIGLETLYQLMRYEEFQLQVYGSLGNPQVGTIVEYFYANFRVKSEAENYSLNYTQGLNHPAWGHNGDDGFGTERPRDFCTRDQDCGGCAGSKNGGWWFTSGCGVNVLTSSTSDFTWPIHGSDVPLEQIFLQLDHMYYKT